MGDPLVGAELRLRQRVLKRGPEVLTDGPQTLEVRLHNGVRLDIWFARSSDSGLFEEIPGNFGSILLCRTGSLAHNIRLVETAKAKGLRWHPHNGVYRGEELIASATEREIFDALGLAFTPPEEREG